MDIKVSESKLYQKLVEVRKGFDYFQKDRTGDQYQYVSGSKVLSELRKKIDEVGLVLVPSVSEVQATTDGKNWVVQAKIIYEWIDAENPEDRLQVEWYGFGQQADPAKAFGSMLTYSERYFLLKFFQAPTDELDPDAFQQKMELPVRPLVVKKGSNNNIDKARKATFALASELGIKGDNKAFTDFCYDRYKVKSKKDMTIEDWRDLYQLLKRAKDYDALVDSGKINKLAPEKQQEYVRAKSYVNGILGGQNE